MSTSLDIQPLWTVKEVAAYLGVSENAVREYVYQNKLEPVGRRGAGGAYVFSKKGVDDWLRSCATEGAERRCGASSPVTDNRHGAHHAEGKRQKTRTRHHRDAGRTGQGASNGAGPGHGSARGERINASSVDDAGDGPAREEVTTSGTQEQPEETRAERFRRRLRARVAREEAADTENGAS